MSQEFPNITSQANADAFESVRPVFRALLEEIRELSRKKPDAIMSKGKVTLINRVLNDILEFTKDEPQGKYLAILDDVQLPQVSDALLMMVQFNVAMLGFERTYKAKLHDYGDKEWITQELLADLEDDDQELE